MKTLLYVNACPRGQGISRTDRLCRAFLSALPADIQVEEVDATAIVPISNAELDERDQLIRAGQLDAAPLRLAQQLVLADFLLIGAPYWDLSFPATLKAYLERISVCGLSFYYNELGQPVGCCRAKRLVYVTTAGGVIGKRNFGYEYVAGLFDTLLGVHDAAFVSAEQLDIVGMDPEPALRQAEETLRSMAQSL